MDISKPYLLKHFAPAKKAGLNGKKESMFVPLNPEKIEGKNEQDSIFFQLDARGKGEGAKANELKEKEIYRESFVRGEKEGYLAGEKKLFPAIDRLSRVLEELDGLKKKIFEESEKGIIKLSLAVAKEVINREVSLNEETVVSIAGQAMEKVCQSETIKIKVHPSHLEIMLKARAQFLETINGLKNITLEEDENLMPGGCMIETEFGGNVDARIDRQLKEIEIIWESKGLRD